MSTIWPVIEAAVADATGEAAQFDHPSSISGGSINAAFQISDGNRRYFVKLNSADHADMFAAEAEGLKELSDADTCLHIPKPICWGTEGSQTYIVMEYLGMGGSDSNAVRRLGEGLAALHHHTKTEFGWYRDNTIGSTHQPNDWDPDWVHFLREKRLGYQLQLAERHGAPGGLIRDGEALLDKLDDFFADYRPLASLLHGDLWTGNYAITSGGEPTIFDPAVYYGDREADLAMTELFGRFPAGFYDAYQAAWPLDAGYKVRKTLYNLYHILNHYNMFGGGYAGQAGGMISRLLSEVR